VSLVPGAIIDDKYRIARQLGAGGMGAVYEAENLRIGRHVAIKVMHAASDRQDVVRFEREARAASKIGSRYIVEVFDLGDLPDGSPYMVMEYLEGETLGARLQTRGKLGAPELVPIAYQILEGLKAAHAAGIVHRDLKPDNVFLVADHAGHDYVKLLDFGISKFRNREGETSGLTRPGFAIGTPHFMSPEQLNASADVDGRADLYAVGVLLYLCLSGDLPFDGETFEALMVKILFRGATPLGSLVPGLDRRLAALVTKAMARAPEDRYQSAAEFQAALAGCDVSGLETTSSSSPYPAVRAGRAPHRVPTPGSWSSTARRLVTLRFGRRRVATALVAALGALLGIGVGTLILRKLRAPSENGPPAVATVPAPAAAASSEPIQPAAASEPPAATATEFSAVPAPPASAPSGPSSAVAAPARDLRAPPAAAPGKAPPAGSTPSKPPRAGDRGRTQFEDP
jgi:eukaryotic-like serine/threonine-protein kinase